MIESRPYGHGTQANERLPETSKKEDGAQRTRPKNCGFPQHSIVMTCCCAIKLCQFLFALKQIKLEFVIHLAEDLWKKLSAVLPIASVVRQHTHAVGHRLR